MKQSPGVSDPQPTVEDMLRKLPGTESTVTRPDGTSLRVVVDGSGPDVLLVHGFGVTADEWSLVQPALVAAGHRVIAYDQRAHGRSTVGSEGIGSRQLRADLKAVAEAYDVRDATLVCHSMGNFVALGLLPDKSFNKRLRRAVLVSPVTGHSAKGAPVARLQGPLVAWGIAQRLCRIRPVGARLAGASLGPDATPAQVEASRQAMIGIRTEVGPYIPMVMRETTESALADITIPLRVLSGTADKTTPAWHAELIATRAPSASIDYVPGCGHMLNWEAPEHIIRAVTQEW